MRSTAVLACGNACRSDIAALIGRINRSLLGAATAMRSLHQSQSWRGCAGAFTTDSIVSMLGTSRN